MNNIILIWSNTEQTNRLAKIGTALLGPVAMLSNSKVQWGLREVLKFVYEIFFEKVIDYALWAPEFPIHVLPNYLEIPLYSHMGTNPNCDRSFWSRSTGWSFGAQNVIERQFVIKFYRKFVFFLLIFLKIFYNFHFFEGVWYFLARRVLVLVNNV